MDTQLPKKAAFSSGKVIISGEHSVVYGEPAIVAALDAGVYCWISQEKLKNSYPKNLRKYIVHILSFLKEKYSIEIDVDQVQLHSDIQIGVGLGSSAAYAHAIILAAFKYSQKAVSKEEIFDLVLEAEKLVHVNPSGADPSAVVYGGVQVFRKNLDTKEYDKSFLNLPRPYSFFLVNSGAASETTGEMVTMVADKVHSSSKNKTTIKAMGGVTEKILEELKSGAFSGESLQQNHELLKKLGIVGERAQEIITSITEVGYYAKVSGAGGVKSGSGMILCYENSENYLSLEKFCKERSLEYIKSTIQ